MYKLVPSNSRAASNVISHVRKKSQKQAEKRFKRALENAYEENKPSGKHLPDKFQYPKSISIIVRDEKSKEIKRVKGTIRKKLLNKLCARHPNATVLVDLGNGVFKSIPIKTFKKLCKIKFILFERDYEFCSIDDNDDSFDANWYHLPGPLQDHIYSINQMLRVFISEEAFDTAISAYLMAKFYTYTGVEKTCHIMYRGGKIESVNYDTLLRSFNLDFEMNFFGK